VSSETPQTLDVVGEKPAAAPVPLPGSVNAPQCKNDAPVADGLILFKEERGSLDLTADASPDEPPGVHVMDGDPLLFVEHCVVHTMNGRALADQPLGAHVMGGDPLLSIERRAVHARNGRAPADQPRGAHVMGGDPLLSIERRAVHARNGRTPADQPLGAHVMGGDPLLSIERRAVHAMKSQAPAGGPPRANPTIGNVRALDRASVGGTGSAKTVEVLTTTAGGTSLSRTGPQPLVSAVPDPPVIVDAARTRPPGDAHATKRPALATKRQNGRATARRRWRFVPLAGAAGAVAVGLGAGGAVAFIVSQGQGGSGSGQATAGAPVDVVVAATTGKADLLPGGTGAAHFTLHNTASSSATFEQVVSGARAVSDNTGLCASSYVSIAQTLPYSFSPAVTVSPGGTSGTQSIPALVKLAPNAPNTCQGVTFTVTFTLSGRSS
jgi:hypothetical protein